MAVVDPATVRFTLKQPFSPLLNNLTLNTGRIVSPAAVKKYGKEFASHPVGTGPFKFVSWDKNVRIVLEANAGYWAGRPKLERIVFRPLVEEQTRVTELLSGGVDFIVDVPPDNVAQVKKDAKLAYYEQPGPHIWWVTLNTEKKPFNDVRVRRAVNYAVNREAIAGDLLKKTATAAIGPVPPSITWAFTDQVTKYPYDPAQAKKLLAEAGLSERLPGGVLDPGVGLRHAVAQDDGPGDPGRPRRGRGQRASIQTFEWGAYLNKYGKGFGQEADMGAMSFMLDPGDPAPMLSLVIDGKGGFRRRRLRQPGGGQAAGGGEPHHGSQEARRPLSARCRSWWWTTRRGSSSTTRSRTRPAAKKVAGFKLHPSFYLFFDKISVAP